MSEPPCPWSQADLEAVPHYPVCGFGGRTPLYKGLVGRVFWIADCAWNLYGCVHCTSGYLDPRPASESRGRAYADYYFRGVEDHPMVRRKGRVRILLHDRIGEPLARGELANGASRQGYPLLGDVLAGLRETVQPARREFLTLLARK